MPRREFTRKVKREALERAKGCCEKCSAVLKKGEAEIDHILPDILGGEPVLGNAQVLCKVCHSEKSADDLRRTRKADRARDKDTGAIAPKQTIVGKGFPKSPKSQNRVPKPEFNLPRRQLYREV